MFCLRLCIVVPLALVLIVPVSILILIFRLFLNCLLFLILKLLFLIWVVLLTAHGHIFAEKVLTWPLLYVGVRVIAKGAEAYIYEDNGTILKVRKPKKYRQPELDQRLRKSRTKKEATAIEKCNEAGIPSPQLLSVDECSIAMRIIDGRRVSDIIAHASESEKGRYAREMGVLLAKIHAIGLCHGDYSPTNIIEKDGMLHVIDFGLCEFSGYYEKRAADLAVMHSALKDENAFAEFIEAYERHLAEGTKVIERFRKNQQRGRYKEREGRCVH